MLRLIQTVSRFLFTDCLLLMFFIKECENMKQFNWRLLMLHYSIDDKIEKKLCFLIKTMAYIY